MIAGFEDCCLWADVVVDELWRQLPPLYKPPRGPTGRCRASELIALALVSECRGWTQEPTPLRRWRGYRHLCPALAFHLVPSAAVGEVPTKKQTSFGCKLHLLVTLGGAIRDLALAPASARDVAVGAGLLGGHADLTVLGDKAYSSAPLAAALQDARAVARLTVPRRNQRRRLPAAAARQIVETVNDQLTAQFGSAAHHAHTFRGLCARLYTTLTAHTLCL